MSAGADSRPAEPVFVNIALPEGRPSSERSPRSGRPLCTGSCTARLGAPHRLTAWLHLLAVTARVPSRTSSPSPSAEGAPGRREPRSLSRSFRASEAGVLPRRMGRLVRRAAAVAYLERIVDLYSRAMCEPPPLYCKTSGAWAEAMGRGGRPEQAAVREWTEHSRVRRVLRCRPPVGARVGSRHSTRSWRICRVRTSRATDGTRASDEVRPLGATYLGGSARPREAHPPMTQMKMLFEPVAPEPFDVYGPLPIGGHPSRGERGDRKDLHDRRIRGALRGRRTPAREAPRGDVHEDGDRRVEGPGEAASGHSGCGCRSGDERGGTCRRADRRARQWKARGGRPPAPASRHGSGGVRRTRRSTPLTGSAFTF